MIWGLGGGSVGLRWVGGGFGKRGGRLFGEMDAWERGGGGRRGEEGAAGRKGCVRRLPRAAACALCIVLCVLWKTEGKGRCVVCWCCCLVEQSWSNGVCCGCRIFFLLVLLTHPPTPTQPPPTGQHLTHHGLIPLAAAGTPPPKNAPTLKTRRNSAGIPCFKVPLNAPSPNAHDQSKTSTELSDHRFILTDPCAYAVGPRLVADVRPSLRPMTRSPHTMHQFQRNQHFFE